MYHEARKNEMDHSGISLSSCFIITLPKVHIIIHLIVFYNAVNNAKKLISSTLSAVSQLRNFNTIPCNIYYFNTTRITLSSYLKMYQIKESFGVNYCHHKRKITNEINITKIPGWTSINPPFSINDKLTTEEKRHFFVDKIPLSESRIFHIFILTSINSLKCQVKQTFSLKSRYQYSNHTRAFP